MNSAGIGGSGSAAVSESRMRRELYHLDGYRFAGRLLSRRRGERQASEEDCPQPAIHTKELVWTEADVKGAILPNGPERRSGAISERWRMAVFQKFFRMRSGRKRPARARVGPFTRAAALAARPSRPGSRSKPRTSPREVTSWPVSWRRLVGSACAPDRNSVPQRSAALPGPRRDQFPCRPASAGLRAARTECATAGWWIALPP